MRFHEKIQLFLKLQQNQSRSLGSWPVLNPVMLLEENPEKKSGIDHDHNQTQPQIMVDFIAFIPMLQDFVTRRLKGRAG